MSDFCMHFYKLELVDSVLTLDTQLVNLCCHLAVSQIQKTVLFSKNLEKLIDQLKQIGNKENR